MPPHSISSAELDAILAEGLAEAGDAARAAWARIRVEPELWRCPPKADEEGGFWVVAIRGAEVIWFNHIEDGFNASPFTRRGVIDRYGCNQTAFHELLASLPEALQAEAFAGRSPAASAPPGLEGPGRIALRQTTYWDLQPDEGPSVRVHFSGKEEAHCAQARYDLLELLDAHPLLLDYQEPWATLYVSDARRGGTGMMAAVSGRLAAATGGWRPSDVGASQLILTLGFGALVEAPDSLARLAAEVVEAHGATPSLQPGRPARPGRRLLRLGPSFVIARAFRFEPRP